jgi:radical SAM superfamily enzyme YgiQ (UPF0313 family)
MNPTKRQSAAEEGSDERLRPLLEKLHGSHDKLNEQLKDDRGVQTLVKIAFLSGFPLHGHKSCRRGD